MPSLDDQTKNEIAARCAKRLGKRLLDTLGPDGDGTLWSEDMARVAMLDALDEFSKAKYTPDLKYVDPIPDLVAEVMPKIVEYYDKLHNSPDPEFEFDEEKLGPTGLIRDVLRRAVSYSTAYEAVSKNAGWGVETARLRRIIMDLAAQLTASSTLMRSLREASVRDQADLEKVAGILQEGQSLINAQIAANDEANTEYRK